MRELPTCLSQPVADQPCSHEQAVPAHVCAPLVGSSISGLYRLAKAGSVPCLRVGVRGRGLRFIPSAVRQALQKRSAWSNS